MENEFASLTTWFAVDAEGYLAVFDSLKTGAIPLSYLKDSFPDSGIWDFYPALACDKHGVGQYDRDPRYVFDLPEPAERGLYEGELVEFTDEADLQKMVDFLPWDEDCVLVRFSVDDVICIFTNMYGHYDEEKAIRRRVIRSEMIGHVFGLFYYEVQRNDSAAWPYIRQTVPQSPMRVEQLTEEGRKLFSLVKFSSLQFSHAPKLQPFEWHPSKARQGRWVDLHGVLHRVT